MNAYIYISTSTGIPIELQSDLQKEYLMMHVGIESETLNSLQLQVYRSLQNKTSSFCMQIHLQLESHNKDIMGESDAVEGVQLLLHHLTNIKQVYLST